MDDTLEGLDPAIREKQLSEMTVKELITIYRIPELDDYVGPEFDQRGVAALDDIAQLVDSDDLTIEDIEVIVQVLGLYFSTTKALPVFAALRARLADVEEGSSLLRSIGFWEGKIKK